MKILHLESQNEVDLEGLCTSDLGFCHFAAPYALNGDGNEEDFNLVEPDYQSIHISPSTSALHYGLSVFEWLKANFSNDKREAYTFQLDDIYRGKAFRLLTKKIGLNE